jgi:hypothetical protein
VKYVEKKNRSELQVFWTLSIARNPKQLRNTTFLKLDLFPSSGASFSSKSRNPVILSVVNHRQDPLDSTCKNEFKFIQMKGVTGKLCIRLKTTTEITEHDNAL